MGSRRGNTPHPWSQLSAGWTAMATWDTESKTHFNAYIHQGFGIKGPYWWIVLYIKRTAYSITEPSVSVSFCTQSVPLTSGFTHTRHTKAIQFSSAKMAVSLHIYLLSYQPENYFLQVQYWLHWNNVAKQSTWQLKSGLYPQRTPSCMGKPIVLSVHLKCMFPPNVTCSWPFFGRCNQSYLASTLVWVDATHCNFWYNKMCGIYFGMVPTTIRALLS